MFSRQTITKDPVSVTPSVFDIGVLLGWYSHPVAINLTGNAAVLDSTAWHSLVSLTVTPSEPELLLIPWIANAVGTIAANDANLTDALLLGDAHINITLGIAGFTNADSELAPSWYIRHPHKNEKSFPFDVTRKLDPLSLLPHTDAADKNSQFEIIPWGDSEEVGKILSSAWNFMEEIDVDTSMGYEKFLDVFQTDITQTYSIPEIKEVHDSINWGEFIDWYANDFSYGYTYPAIKDKERDIPWDTFSSRFGTSWGFDYSHPAFKDVFKIIFTGPNWYPKYCEHQHTVMYGELILNWDSATDLAYAQYFDTEVFVRNVQEKLWPKPQADKLPISSDRVSMYPSGSMFSGRPIGVGDSTIQMRSFVDARMNIKAGYLDHPIYMKDRIANYPLVCYDGYRNGPKDSLERVPYFPVVIPNIRSYYIVMNSVSVKTLANEVIPVTQITLSVDRDSWCWSFQAEVRRKVDLDLIKPTGGSPVEIEVIINGNTWRFIVENYGENRQFAQTRYQISGRTPSASLATPYSAPASLNETSTRQAVQLADAAVAGTGYTVDFDLTDWLVPANSYRVIDKTPMQQLITIANAAGGTVQSHPSATTISLVPWYPFDPTNNNEMIMPWTWGAAIVDAALPTYASKSTQYEARYQHNGAYVSGENQGVTVLVKRTGTDGADQPQMVVDPLITATEAGLQLGKKLLADSGNREVVTLEAPLFADPGLLTPGMLISITDQWETWKGMVIGTQIRAQRPKVTQILSVLRYLGT